MTGLIRNRANVGMTRPAAPRMTSESLNPVEASSSAIPHYADRTAIVIDD